MKMVHVQYGAESTTGSEGGVICHEAPGHEQTRG